jgi:hypothetical protein
MNRIHALTSCSFKVYFNIIFPSTLNSFKMSLSFSLPTKTSYVLLSPPPRHIFPTHLVLLDLILMLPFHLCVGLPSGHFLTSPTRILCSSPLQCVLHFPPFSSILMYRPSNIWWRRHIMNPTPPLCLHFKSPVTADHISHPATTLVHWGWEERISNPDQYIAYPDRFLFGFDISCRQRSLMCVK